MKSLVIIVLLIFALTASAQPGPDTLWTRTYGWAYGDEALCVCQTLDGGFILAGVGTVVSPPPLQADGFLIKTDAEGVMQWWHEYGLEGDDIIYAVIQLPDSGYVAAGYTEIGYYPRAAAFRTNSVGDTLWTQIRILPTIEGRFGGVTLFRDTLLAFAETEIGASVMLMGSAFYNLAGQWIADVTVSVPTYSASTNFIYSLSDTGIAVGGTWRSSVDSCGAWFATCGNDCTFTRYVEPPYLVEAFDCAETPDGFLLVGTVNDEGTFLCRITRSGELIWRQYLIEYSARLVYAITPAIGGGYVIAGTRHTPDYNYDMYLAKIDENGTVLWQQTYGTPENDEVAQDVIQTPDGGFVLAGWTDPPGPGNEDWYVVRTRPDPDLFAPQHPPTLPRKMTLSNYPNPFNSTTVIRLDVPEASHAQLSITDLLGRHVATLYDGMLELGEHKFTFDGSNLPSGIYFARVQAREWVKTQKLLLLK